MIHFTPAWCEIYLTPYWGEILKGKIHGGGILNTFKRELRVDLLRCVNDSFQAEHLELVQ